MGTCHTFHRLQKKRVHVLLDAVAAAVTSLEVDQLRATLSGMDLLEPYIDELGEEPRIEERRHGFWPFKQTVVRALEPPAPLLIGNLLDLMTRNLLSDETADLDKAISSLEPAQLRVVTGSDAWHKAMWEGTVDIPDDLRSTDLPAWGLLSPSGAPGLADTTAAIARLPGISDDAYLTDGLRVLEALLRGVEESDYIVVHVG